MTHWVNRLLRFAADRLGLHVVEHVPDYQRRALRIMLPRATYLVPPGLRRLERRDVLGDPPCMRLPLPAPLSWRELEEGPAALDARAVAVREVVLERREHWLELELEATERIPVTNFDRSGSWRAHPPSKRRHLRAWRYAPDHQKLAYAPLRGRYGGRLPWWARHPDEGRRAHLGHLVLEQRVHVYAQPGAELEQLLERELERPWVADMSSRIYRG